jgi:hypothetical protein
VAKSYWQKAKKDEARMKREWDTERPVTKEQSDKMPKSASVRQAQGSEEEAARLRMKSVRYPRDTEKDTDYEGAAKRTESEISKEHKSRENDTHTFSPMMSRLWSALGWSKKADLEPVPNAKSMPAGESPTRIREQIEELRTALKGVKAEDQGADDQSAVIQSRIQSLESELGKSASAKTGRPQAEVISETASSLLDLAQILSVASQSLAKHHAELRFAKENPFADKGEDKGEDKKEDKGEDEKEEKPKSDKPKSEDKPKDKSKDKPEPKKDKAPAKLKTLVEDLGETMDDMAATIESLMKEVGLGKGKQPKKDDALPPLGMKGPGGPGMEKEIPLPPMGGQEAPGPLEPMPMPPMEKEGPMVGPMAATKAVFTKLASKADKTKPDIEASYWTVYRGDEILVRASVKDLYPVKAEERQAAFDWASSKEYGKKLLEAVRAEGVEKIAAQLGIVPMVKSAAKEKGKVDMGAYYRQIYPAEYVSQLLKDHEKKASDEKAGLMKKAEDAEKRASAATAHAAKLEEEIRLHAKAEKALNVVGMAIDKGLVDASKRDEYVDRAMLMDDRGFEAFAQMVTDARILRKASKDEPTPAKELIRQASSAPGLKSAIVMQSKSEPQNDLRSSLEALWKKPSVQQ